MTRLPSSAASPNSGTAMPIGRRSRAGGGKPLGPGGLGQRMSSMSSPPTSEELLAAIDGREVEVTGEPRRLATKGLPIETGRAGLAHPAARE